MLGAKQNLEGVNAGLLGLPSDEADGSTTECTKPTVSKISLEIVRVSVNNFLSITFWLDEIMNVAEEGLGYSGQRFWFLERR